MNITVSERLKPQYNFIDVNFKKKKKDDYCYKNHLWLPLEKGKVLSSVENIEGCQEC